MKELLLLVPAALVCAGWCSAATQYAQHNLVSDIPGLADQIDPCLIDPRGIVTSPTSPFWISDHGTGLATIYNGNGIPASLIVSIPGPASAPGATQQCGATEFGVGTPTGIIFNNTTSFMLGASPASFLLSSEQGVIVGWNGAAGHAAAILSDRSSAGALYKGLAIGAGTGGPMLYAADFANGAVDVFDGNMNLLSLSGAFTDSTIPAGFAPFNIQNLGGSLYVTYAKQDPTHQVDVPGAGNGYLDVYDPNGVLLQKLVSGGPLNSPWGMALAPSSFGSFGGALLVGNFGDGTINAFDSTSGASLGAIQDGTGASIQIAGLWALTFGNGNHASPSAAPSGGDINTLYFTAGIAGPDTIGSHGLLGTVQPAATVATNGAVNAASYADAISPGAFVAIFGTSLAATTRSWTSTDFVNGALPVQLDGVSVTIDGKAAYVYFVSPNQINVIAPADSNSGDVPVIVTNNNVASGSATVPLQAAAPAFFAIGQNVIAAHADGTLVGLASVLPGATPALPGETIVVYGTGFGETNPAVDGLVATAAAPLASPPSVTIGGAPATVTFAGLSEAGLDQINVTIPPLPSGSTGVVAVPISAAVGTFSTQTGLSVSVQSGN